MLKTLLEYGVLISFFLCLTLFHNFVISAIVQADIKYRLINQFRKHQNKQSINKMRNQW